MLKLSTRAILFSVFLFLFSCKSDPCEKVNCQNGGTCNDGTCACPDGYEGTECQTEWTAKFIGTYSVTDHINFKKSIYNTVDPDTMMTISYTANIFDAPFVGSNDFSSVFIHNADNDTNNYVYSVVNKSDISITSRPFDLKIIQRSSYDISGSGTMSGNTINITYAVTGYDGTATITSTMVKQ